MLTHVEVRCCCQPQKLLGWLPVREDHVFEGRVVRFAIVERVAQESYSFVQGEAAGMLQLRQVVLEAYRQAKQAAAANEAQSTERRGARWAPRLIASAESLFTTG